MIPVVSTICVSPSHSIFLIVDITPFESFSTTIMHGQPSNNLQYPPLSPPASTSEVCYSRKESPVAMSSNMKLVSFADLLDEQLVSHQVINIDHLTYNGLLQPSPPATFTQIIEAYRREGRGDVETLKAVLAAKQAEEDVSLTQLASCSPAHRFPSAHRQDPRDQNHFAANACTSHGYGTRIRCTHRCTPDPCPTGLTEPSALDVADKHKQCPSLHEAQARGTVCRARTCLAAAGPLVFLLVGRFRVWRLREPFSSTSRIDIGL